MRHKAGVYEKYIKRLLDIVLSGCALIVLSPLLLVTAILVRVKLGSPVIFCQERPGKDEKIFKLHKFRSMSDARDETGNLLPDKERLTGFGKKLRSLSIDELPELWDIFRGKMSIVGPRPLLVKYLPLRLIMSASPSRTAARAFRRKSSKRFSSASIRVPPLGSTMRSMV